MKTGSKKKPSGVMKLRSAHRKTKAHKDKSKYNRKDEIKKLKEELSFAQYKQAGLFPHPHWAEDEQRILKQIKQLEKQRCNHVWQEQGGPGDDKWVCIECGIRN